MRRWYRLGHGLARMVIYTFAVIGAMYTAHVLLPEPIAGWTIVTLDIVWLAWMLWYSVAWRFYPPFMRCRFSRKWQ